MRPFKFLLVAVFVACIPVFLVASNVRWVINAPFLYSYGFDKYDVAETTGIEREELIKAGAAFREYFNNDDNVLDVRVVQDRPPQPERRPVLPVIVEPCAQLELLYRAK